MADSEGQESQERVIDTVERHAEATTRGLVHEAGRNQV